MSSNQNGGQAVDNARVRLSGAAVACVVSGIGGMILGLTFGSPPERVPNEVAVERVRVILQEANDIQLDCRTCLSQPGAPKQSIEQLRDEIRCIERTEQALVKLRRRAAEWGPYSVIDRDACRDIDASLAQYRHLYLERIPRVAYGLDGGNTGRTREETQTDEKNVADFERRHQP